MAGSWVEQQGRELEGVFNDLFAVDYARPGTLTATEHKSARGVLFKLMTNEAATIFLEPVDPNILLNYYTVIKHPMDFRTISEKLTFPKYRNLEELTLDIEQIFTNCFTYNAPGVWGHNQGKKLQKYFHSLVGKDAVSFNFYFILSRLSAKQNASRLGALSVREKEAQHRLLARRSARF
jgi:hypothetical protein